MAVGPIAIRSRPAAAGAGWVAHFGAAGLVWSANLVRFVPALSYRIAPPPPLAIVVYYGAAGVAWHARSAIAFAERRMRAVAAIPAGPRPPRGPPSPPT